MSRAQRGTHLLGLVDSDSEDGLSGPASTRFGSSKAATKTNPTSTITKPKSILKEPTTAATVKKEPATKPTAASTTKQATTKATTTKATTRQPSASGAGASTMAPAKRKTASTPSVANKRTAASVTASANKVTKASAQKPKPLTARQKAALARAAMAESSGNVTATPSTVGKATRTSGRGKRAAAAMAPVEEEEMESTEQTETILEEDTTMHDVTATDEVEEAPKETTTTTRATRGRPRKAAAAAAMAETPVPATATATRGGGRGRKKKVEEDEATTTTQQQEVTEEITHEETQIEEGEEEEESWPIPGAWHNGPPASTSRKSSSLGLGFKTHTAGARNDDPELRRKLGEMTQKYEALELKYRDLREVAVKEAERNFDRLRKQSEERTAASDQLIAALKDELSSKKEAAREITHLQKQLEASESQLSTLNAKVTELTSSLTKSKTEINALNIKLTASRQAEAAAAAKIGQPQVPGSAMKNKQNGNRMLTMGNSEAIAQATQQHQLKEDLYSDLTGLIVRGVKRDQQTGEDVYDCIQTGKNGTLHFKLAHISANTAHIDADETTQIFDEDQFHYMPQLDTNRDRALIDLLPDYLVEEITFPRQHAAKFYSRVNKALTETVAPQ
ncbi:chromosome segregation protein Csm1/Pcs1-domain-containing protein [Pseudoneurospora amorphoporcata]|uniref:Chromosome segregation protein Csm1/Pcs1-domain-containing protein n=1 Tax=Pseudoneurospora amorphoporcata TaxID=241081 RepID=A0AAN6P2C9_9PEZI|nr:chromosome segregation protein Csm1/Pcs1-domain-containing protein [Pseudoneurospora amorphoporcata]